MLIPLPLADADVTLHTDLPLPTSSTNLVTALSRDIAWRQEDITLFGRTYRQPRLLAWYGDPEARYRYSRVDHDPLPWTPLLKDLRQAVESHTGQSFNSVLLNRYRDGADAMGAHSDDEPELGPAPVIASLSLGAARPFVFHSRHTPRQPAHRLILPDGSLLLMAGTTQRWWKHSLPRTRHPVGERINLTFRLVRPPALHAT